MTGLIIGSGGKVCAADIVDAVTQDEPGGHSSFLFVCMARMDGTTKRDASRLEAPGPMGDVAGHVLMPAHVKVCREADVLAGVGEVEDVEGGGGHFSGGLLVLRGRMRVGRGV